MTKILCKYNFGFKWYTNNQTWVKGYLYDKENKYYEKQNLLQYISENLDNNIENFLENCNGIFSVIFIKDETCFLYSDKSRFFTLFYSFIENQYVISDDIQELISLNKNLEINELAYNEFRGMGHTFFNRTLIKNIYQVRASELIRIENENITYSSILFQFYTNSFLNKSYESLVKTGFNVLFNGFKRIFENLENRQIVVPLSGGFDSRCIVAILKKLNIKNVVCFTYGKFNHYEIKLSKEVAEKLGYKWYFIDYEKIKIDNSSFYKNYISYACQFSSMFFLSEYYAVKYLKENQLIDDNAVFIPGHSGDLLGGSQYIKAYKDDLKPGNFHNKFIENKYVNELLKPLIKKLLVNNYKNEMKIEHIVQKDFDLRTFFEHADIEEKIAKFIINSSKVFDFFGYEIRLPFWDDKIMDFFKHIPYKYRKGKYLYNDILNEKLFKEYGISLKNELQPTVSIIKFQKLKDKLKKMFGRRFIFKYVRKNDWANYLHLTKDMQEEMQQHFNEYNPFPPSVNSFLIQYCLFKAKEKAGSQ